MRKKNMYNSIEIPDSDDEMLEMSTDVAKSINSDSEIHYEHIPEKQRKIAASSLTESHNTSTTSSDATGSSPPMANNSSSSNSMTQVRHRSRKTQHTVRNAAGENEMQFESIHLDDDDAAQRTIKRPAAQLSTVESGEGDLKSLISNMVNTDDVQALVQQIANERVRCNYLLDTYQLPDMNFALNTPLETLKIQFLERLQQRKEPLNIVKSSMSSTVVNATVKTKVEKL